LKKFGLAEIKMEETLIKLQGISKTYEGWKTALRNVDLEIKKGEFVFLVGPSGAGKTTLLKLLWREEEPSSGLVFVDGYSNTDKDRKRIAELRRKLGIVFEDLKLLGKRSLEENLSLPLRIMGKNERHIRSKVSELLGAFNLYSKRRSLPEQLSAGEKKKLAIARAVINEPLILLGDEPFGGLDEKFSSEIIGFLKDINLRGTTVFLATHRADLLKSFKGRVVKLENGEIK
jgi:cell division transport system ATP-binding protein